MSTGFLLTGNLITLFTGFSKTGIPGAGILAAILLANLTDHTRDSVGILLPLLLVADVFAIATYRKHTDWRMIGRLLPPTLLGVAIGWWLLNRVDARAFGPLMGGLVLFQLLLDLLRRKLQWTRAVHHPLAAVFFGVLTGVTTTLGNMAGPVMSLYLLSLGLDKQRFMGSMAWFFFLVNAIKIPIFAGTNLITAESLQASLHLLPGVVIGALVGRKLFRHIPPGPFQRLVQLFAALAALRLLLIR